MKKLFTILGVLIILVIAGFYGFRWFTKRPSPETKITYQQKGLDMQVVYSQPSKKGRKIFGGIVPYNMIWRTGANEATIFETKKDIKVGGKKLPSGKYSLFTIPKQSGNWTMIFNKVYDMWGAFSYDQTQDALRLEVPVQTIPDVEVFNISFVDDSISTNLTLKWETTLVSVPISE